MIRVGARRITFAEVVDDEAEDDVFCGVSPESGRERYGVIPMWGKEGDELIIGQAAGLWKAVHTTSNFDVDKIVVNERGATVLIDDALWDHVNRDTHVFIAFHRRPKVEILEVGGHVSSIWSGESAVDQ
jgi:hypothetical protein